MKLISFFLATILSSLSLSVVLVNAAGADRTLQQTSGQATIDFYNPAVDLCDNQPPGVDGPPMLGVCDTTKFPTCEDGKTEICFNRKPSRDFFDPVTHNPIYYIQYDRVFCYPVQWGGCSSCTPGRYCKSEQRCILEEINYPCEQWY